jgi:dienelactone hydrolase
VTAPLRSSDPRVFRHVPPARAFYFGPDDRRVFGWYHAAVESEARDCAMVVCAPHGYEAVCSHRALRRFAEALALTGISVVRFDYHGFGDSPGDYEDPGRMRAWLDSIGSAIDVARSRSGASSVVLGGVRLGATLALAAAAERDDIDALILWAALPTGRAYLREGRAFTRLMAAQPRAATPSLPDGYEQIGGFVLTNETVASLSSLDPLSSGRTSAKAALWIPRDDVNDDGSAADRLTQLGVEVERCGAAGYAAMMVDPHQSVVPTAVIDAACGWLRQRYPERVRRTRRTHVPTPDADGLWLRAPSTGDVRRRPIRESPAAIGDGLFGVLAEPAASDAGRKGTGVLMANAGCVHRIGPNRLYVTLARQWASLGYTVLRMDLGGLGDSDTPDDGVENHPYPSHAVRDIQRGIELLRSRGVARVVVAGLCSGAHAAFHAGIDIPGLDGLIVINPIVFYWKPTDALDVSAWMNYGESKYYESAMRRWQSWRRLLTGKVNVANVARTMLKRLWNVVSARGMTLLRALHVMPEALEDPARDFGRIVARGTNVLLLFSEGDPGLDFLRRHHRAALRRLAQRRDFTFEILPNADHTLTALDARRRAEKVLTSHMLEHHPHV